MYQKLETSPPYGTVGLTTLVNDEIQQSTTGGTSSWVRICCNAVAYIPLATMIWHHSHAMQLLTFR